MTRRQKTLIGSVSALVALGAAIYYFRWIFGLLLLIAMGFGTWEYEEIARITSPDGKVDALLIRGNGGATTSYTYSVYLVRKGGSTPKSDEALFVADHTKQDVQVRWTGHKQLRVEYKRAYIHHFSNFWYDGATIDDSPANETIYEVAITEGPPLPAAPP